jgi:hypothetical protein
MTNLETLIAEGRLIRDDWTGIDAQGRETACLLAALSPEVGKAQDPSVCPADVMPQWLAHLTPFIDDAGTLEQWPLVLRRYAGLVSRWSVLTPVDWHRLDYTCRRLAVEESALHCNAEQFPKVVAAVQTVIALCRRVENGDDPPDEEWEAAAAGAWAAAAVGAWEAVGAWARAVGARAAAAAAVEAGPAAEVAADRLISALLDAINDKITEAEART